MPLQFWRITLPVSSILEPVLTVLCIALGRTPVLEKASKAVWELILDNDGLGKEIIDTVQKVFCRLGGVDMMPAPPAAGPHQVKDCMAVDKGEKSNATDPSSSRKRPFSDMSRKSAGAVTNGGGTDQHESSEDGN
jgi:hypothetical protein